MRTPSGSSKRTTRREVLRAIGVGAIGSAVPHSMWRAAAEQPSSTAPRQIVVDRAPLAAAVFTRLPLGSIQPRGWLLEELREFSVELRDGV